MTLRLLAWVSGQIEIPLDKRGDMAEKWVCKKGSESTVDRIYELLLDNPADMSS